MGKELQRYDRKSVNNVGQSANAIVSAAEHVQTQIQLAYYTANIKGRFLQIEADMILEHELGLPPRRKKTN